ncbi:MAG: PilZ domain-containing protein [Terracidiphilus sp.]
MEEVENASGLAASLPAQLTPGQAAPDLERRETLRYAVDEQATLLVVSNGSMLAGRIVELSLGGCRLAMERRLPIAPHTGIEVSFKIRGIAFRLSGETVWNDGNAGVGVRFGPMNARRRAELLEVFAEEQAAIATREEELAAQEAAAKAAAQAEAQSSPPAEPTAEAGAAGVSEEPASMAERRRFPRYKVEQSSCIYLVKIGSKLPGQVVNLSLGGCRIRTEERFPVGIYTRVEIEFQLRGQLVRLGGVIQAIYGRHEVGVRFLDVSPRKLEQLADLIREMFPVTRAGGQA